MKYLELSTHEASDLYEKELKQYKKYQSEKLALDMSRGKPCKEQLDLVRGIFDAVNSESDFKLENGLDARNYGGIDGIPELRQLFAELFGVNPNNVLVGDNSSLSFMYDLVQQSMQFGVGGGIPWNKTHNIKFICLVPGYDRHFAVTEHFGINMISVPFRADGDVDIDVVEGLVESDSNIKGIWCVPKNSNPTGVTYSDEAVERLAKMKAAADDFRIYWDNAYAVHTVYGDTPLKNIMTECIKAGNPDRVYMFSSTSKITMPGAGVSVLISSEKNLKEFKSHLQFRTIGPNKVSQLTHYRYLKSVENILKIMNMQADIIRPKFDTVLKTLESEFVNGDIISWTKPEGGYFISVDILTGSAKEVVRLSAEAGVKLTPAGATYPLGMDINDRNIRIAPTFPPLSELAEAMKIFVSAIKLSALSKIKG